MATNKRKDAAALFELLDKSTLRVPKNATGALKIPSWWSSKTNPPSKSSAGVAAVASATGVAAPEKAVTAQPAPAQAAISAKPGTDTPPSIRPAAVAPVRPGGASTPGGSTLPTPARVYAPQTVNPATLNRAGRPRYLPGTQVPIWVAALGGIAALAIIVAVLWSAMHAHSAGLPGSEAPPDLGVPGRTIPSITTYDPRRDGAPEANPPAGRVLPSQSDRDPNLYYLVIERYPRQDIAEKAAKFMADHGVDVSIESSRGYFWLISGKAFAKMSAPDAQAFQRKVIEIGREPFEGRKRKLFNSAYFTHVTRAN